MAAAQNLTPIERNFAPLLPVTGLVSISARGWIFLPGNELVLPRAGGLSATELSAWQAALYTQAQGAERRAPSFFQDVGERPAALLRAGGYDSLEAAWNTPRRRCSRLCDRSQPF